MRQAQIEAQPGEIDVRPPQRAGKRSASKSGQAMLGMQSFAALEEAHYPLVVGYLRQLNR